MNGYNFSLSKGDKVAVIAPAGKIDKNDIVYALDMLKSWGLKITVGKHLSSEYSVFAGTDCERAEDLQKALDDKNIKAIICARGGYGSIRTLEHIRWDLFLENPKPICGFSDITVIHSLLSKYSIPSLHSLMPINIKKAEPQAIDSYQNALFGQELSYEIASDKLNRQGAAKGMLTGGNVTILLSIKGTKFEPDYAGKILFIEDLGECHYHMDRIFQNFKQTIFQQISGLIVGQFSDMRDSWKAFGKNACEIINEAAAPFNFPIIYNFPAGHVPDNRSLWMNKEVTIESRVNTSSIRQ